jgi:DNA-nicking Smr family endonuclease
MSNKKKAKKDQKAAEPTPPKFSGFKALADGLKDFKEHMPRAEAARGSEAKGVSPGASPVAPPARRPEPRPKPEPVNNAEDELTFHRMMSGVTPLDTSRGGSRIPVGATRIEPGRVRPADLREKAREEAKSVLEHLHHLVDDAVRFEVTDDGKRVEGRRVDVPPSLVRELRRGVLPIDGRLDLHGFGAGDAREKLLEFLRTQRARGERCVLVIHGKGEHSIGKSGVLRGEISAWLSQGRAREHVAAFATAREDDGGEGAVYVALRR